eukprot:140735-Prymnesium_polylepis.1
MAPVANKWPQAQRLAAGERRATGGTVFERRIRARGATHGRRAGWCRQCGRTAAAAMARARAWARARVGLRTGGSLGGGGGAR